MLRSLLWSLTRLTASSVRHPFGQALNLVERSQGWSREQLMSHRDDALRALVNHCYEHVPYYRGIMQERGLTPKDFQSARDLSKLPFLTKESIRQNGEALRAGNIPDERCVFSRSGGTTAEPIRVAYDRRARAMAMACYLRGFHWMGYRMGQPMVHLFGGSLGLNKKRTLRVRFREWLLNNRFVPAFELSPDNVEDCLRVIRRSAGGVIVGYASALYNLAEFMAAANVRGLPLNSAICTAEQLPEDWKKRMEESFQIPVYSYYGCGEVNSLGYQHPGNEGYIVPQEHVIIEPATDDPALFREEGSGACCVTALYSFAMPILRYLNGDLLETAYVNQGFPHQRIVRLDGRVMDYLLASDGHQVSGALGAHMILLTGLPIWKWQLVQVGSKSIEFHYAVRNETDLSQESRTVATHVLKKHLGQDMEIRYILGQFETPSSGKHRLIVNKLGRNQQKAVSV